MGGKGLGVKTSGVGRGLFWQNPFSKQQCSVEALTGKYLVVNLPSCIRPLLRMLIMIIVELIGRRRQSPILLGREGQSLGTKDTLNIGPVDTH